MGFDLREFLNANNSSKKKQAPAPASTAMPKQTNLFAPVANFASRAYDQINTLDSGRSYQTRTPSASQAQRGVIHQTAANTGNIGRSIGSSLIKGANTAAAGIGGYYGVGKIEYNALFNRKNLNNTINGVQQSLDHDLAPGSGLFGSGTYFKDSHDAATASTKELAGKAINNGVQIAAFAAPELKLLRTPEGAIALRTGEQFAKDAALKGSQELINPVVSRLTQNAVQGAAGSALGQQVENGKIDLKQTAKDAVTAAALAEIHPVTTALAGKAVKGATKTASKVSDLALAAENTRRANAGIPLRPKVALTTNELGALGDYSGYLNGEKNGANASELHDLDLEARAAANKLGIDITSGNTLDRANRISQELDKQYAYQKVAGSPEEQAVLEGGYVKKPFVKDPIPKVFTPLKEDPKYPNSYIPAKLPDVINDTKLFEKYPDLKDVTVKYHSPGTEAPGLTGKYDPKTKTISLPYDTPDTTKVGSIIHEIQHAIQDVQGRSEKTAASDFHAYADHPLEVEARAKSEALKGEYQAPASEPTPKPLTIEPSFTPKEVAYNEAKAKLQENHAQVPTIPQNVEDTLNNTKLANPTLNHVKGVGEEFKNLFSPTHGPEAKGIANDLRATLGNTNLKQNLESVKAKDDVNFFKKMSTGDHLNFIQRIDSGVAQPTAKLQALADKIHAAQEQDYQLAQTIKPGVNHIDNYFPRAGFWDNSNKQVDSFLSQWAKPTLGGKPSALETRGIPTIYDGIKYGLQPKESNPAIIALTSRNQLIKAAEAEKFKAEQLNKGIDPAITQQYIDRSLGRGLKDSSAFQLAKSTSNALNSTQLGLSGFHVTGTALNAITSQFANGLQDIAHGHPIKGVIDAAKAPFAPAEYIFKGSKIIKDFKAGTTSADIQNIAEGGGRIGAQVDYKATGLAKSLEQLKSGSVKEGIKGVASAPFRAFNTAAKPIMEYWVPRIKAGAEKELIDRKLSELPKDANPETIRAAKAAAIDSIDNRFGQLTQDNLMWNKTLKDGMGLVMRSPGWNIGTIREIGGGLTDFATKTARGKGLSERSAYTVSLAATTMMLGTAMSYMFTGKPPQDAKDYFYPKTGKTDKNGNEERVSLPTYAKDVFAFSHDPVQTVKNKAAPGIAIAQNLATNKDYFGNLIRNPQDSAGTQAKQTGDFLAKSVLPFSVTAGNQRAEKTPSTATQSFFGVAPAPGYITKSNFSQKVQAALSQATGSKPLTPEQQKLVTDKTEAKNQLKAGSTDALQNLVRSGQITAKQGDNLFLTSQKPSLANQYAYLLKVDPKSANDLLKTAGPDDLKQLQNVPGMSDALAKYATKNNTTSNAASAPSSPSSTTNTTSLPSGKVTATVGGSQKTFANQAAADKAIALDKFKSSPAKTMTSGDTYFYKAKDGSVKSKSTAQQAYDSQASGRQLALDSAVRSNDLKTWTNLASQEYDALEKLKSQYDPQTEQKQIDAITIKQQNLKQKASGYSTKGYIKKSTGAKKAKKFDYAKGLSTTNKTAFTNATALRNLVKKTRITKRRLT